MARDRNTNILAMPLAHLTVTTGNNEDWIDVINYQVDTELAGGYRPPLDLRGISFAMQLRYQPGAHDVVISASTLNGWISVGGPPDIGHLIFYIPATEMKSKFAGVYQGDVVASDKCFERVVLSIELTIVEGLTRL